MIHIPRRVLIAGAAVAVPVVAGAAWALTRSKTPTHVEAPGPFPRPGGEASPGTIDAAAAPPATITVPSSSTPVETAAPPIARDPALPTVSHLAAPATAATTTYTVKSGDTLYAIGQRFHVSVAALAELNHIANPAQIQVGQVITIPVGSTTPPPPTTTSTPPHPVTPPTPTTPAPAPAGQPKVPPGSAVYSVNTSKKLIALTFDDGPNGAYTDAILGVLKQHKVHATFFVLGENVARDGARLRKEVAAGHAIGNHSWDHPQLTGLSSTEVRGQLKRTSDKIEQITGKRPDTFRAPYGARSSSVDAVGKSLGMRDILWDVDTVDWSRPGSAAITNEAVSSAHRGSIILMHDGGGNRSQTAKSLDSTITQLQAKGYQFVTVPQLMAASGK